MKNTAAKPTVKNTIETSRENYEQRHRRKKVTFTLTEYNRLLRRFSQSGEENLNQFIKKCALQTRIDPSLDNVFYKQMTAQIRRTGTNLNQIAHHLNAHFTGTTSSEIRREIEAVKALMHQILKK